jgi:hypothetical protein
MGRGLPNASEILQIGAWTTLAGIADVEIKTHVALGCTRLKAPTGCKLVSCTATEQISRPKLAHTKTMRKAEAGLVFAFDPEQLFLSPVAEECSHEEDEAGFDRQRHGRGTRAGRIDQGFS